MSLEKAIQDLTEEIKALRVEIKGVKSVPNNTPGAKITPNQPDDRKAKEPKENPDSSSGLNEADENKSGPKEKAPEEKPAPAAEPVKTVSEEDEKAARAERMKICNDLYSAYYSAGRCTAVAAKQKCTEIIKAFGSPDGKASSVEYERHDAFMAYMKKKIEEAENA